MAIILHSTITPPPTQPFKRKSHPRSARFHSRHLSSYSNNKFDDIHVYTSSLGIIMQKVEITIGILLVLILLGFNYTTNTPQGIQDSIMHLHSLSTTQFNLLYSLETLPSLFLIIPLGILFDVMGAKLLIPACLLLLMGQTLLLVYTPLRSSFSFLMMLFGRVMEGMSGQILYMAMGVMTTKWMGNLSGLVIVLPEIGEIMNVFMTPALNILGGLYLVNFVGLLICVVSFCSTILLWRTDRRYENMTKEEEFSNQVDVLSCSTFKNFSRVFWLLIVICAINEGIFIPFMYNANTLLQVRFGIQYKETGQYLWIPFAATMITTAILSKLLKRVTKNKLIIVAALSGVIAHGIIYLIPNTKQEDMLDDILIVVSFVIFGIGKGSYYSVIYPTVGQVVSKKYRGTAYALVSFVQAVNVTIIPEVSAWIIEQKPDKQEGYTNSSLLFFLISILGLTLTLYLFFLKLEVLCQVSPSKQETYFQQQGETSITSRSDISQTTSGPKYPEVV